MKPAFTLSPLAQNDLDKIWDYTFDRWDINRADSYLAEIHAALITVAQNPQIGRDCGSIRIAYRRYAVGSHILFYRSETRGIVIARILHQSMQPERHL